MGEEGGCVNAPPLTSSDGLIVVLQEHRKLIGVTHQKISFVNALNPFYHIAMGWKKKKKK